MICNLQLNAQDLKWNVRTGIGYTDLFHLQISRQITENNSLGIGAGFLPSNTEEHHQVSLYHEITLLGSKKFENLQTWHFDQRFTYYQEESERYRSWNLLVEAALGRFFNLSSRIALNLDAGVYIKMHSEVLEKQYDPGPIPPGCVCDGVSLQPPPLPEFGPIGRVQLIIRF